jgi:hypothetical protein
VAHRAVLRLAAARALPAALRPLRLLRPRA